MPEGLRRFFQSPAGKAAAGALVIVGLLVVIWSAKANFGGSDAYAALSKRTYICSETGKTFEVEIEEGLTNPTISPFTDRKTGYPVEYCYWTADGKRRPEPFPLLLNQYVNKPGPTWCPDCGRLVRAQQAPPMPDTKPPPLKKDYDPRRDREE